MRLDQFPYPPMPALELDRDACAQLPTALGIFQVLAFRIPGTDVPQVVLMRGDVSDSHKPLVRIQSSCMTGEVFGSYYCDCAEQLRLAMELIAHEDRGLIIHLAQEGRGNGLGAKLQIYSWMQTHHASSDDACAALGYPTDRRTYEVAAGVLSALGLWSIRLLTNNPDKVDAIRHYGIDVSKVPLRAKVNQYNHDYLLEKQFRHNHDLGFRRDGDDTSVIYHDQG